MCPEDCCDLNSFPFATRGEWEDHLTWGHHYYHQGSSVCPICKMGTYDINHLGQHMEEIALTILPTNPDSDDGTDINSGSASSETSSQFEFNPSMLDDNDRRIHVRPQPNVEGGETLGESGVDIEKDIQCRIDKSRNMDSTETTAINQSTQKTQETTPGSHDCTNTDCGSKFKRPSDLQKHEKTHNRPWKCPVPTCKYYEHGWPTEKELSRHVNDKHTSQKTMYQCELTPCRYLSKRESNFKQHMVKAHGWTYVRTRNGGKLVRQAPQPAVHQRPSSSPGAPTVSKAVDFDSHLENIQSSPHVNHQESMSYPGKLIMNVIGPTGPRKPLFHIN